MISPKSTFVTVIIVTLVAIGPVSTDMYLPAFPALMQFFDAGINQIQLTLSIFLIGFAFAQLIYGPLSDRYGRKPILYFGMAIFLVSSLAIVFVNSIEMLILLRFFQAVGGSSGPVLGRAMVRDIHGPKESARQLAYIGSAMALAPAAAPIIGSYFTVWWGWHAVFIFLACYAVVVIILLKSYVQETAPPGNHHILKVNVLLGRYLTLLRHSNWIWYTLCCTFVFCGLFSFLSGSSVVIINFLNFSEEEFGLFFTLIVLGYIAGALMSAKLINSIKKDTIIGWGSLLACLSGVIMAILALFEFYHILAIIIPQMFFMMAVGFVMPLATAEALAPFPEMAGTSSALLGFIQMSVAAMVGIIVGHMHDGTPRSMAISIAIMGCLTLFSYFMLLRSKCKFKVTEI